MFRGGVLLFLLPGLLLTQSAALSHAHGGSHSAGHDLRPHIHTKSIPADHGHEYHGHSHGGHHHHHHDDDASEPVLLPALPPAPISDHDSDAVFIPALDVVVHEWSALIDEAAPILWVAHDYGAAIFLGTDTTLRLANWTHPPPPGCFCPLYIRHFSLVI